QGALRAELATMRINWWGEVGVASVDLLRVLEKARPVFEQADDDQGLTEVHRTIAEVESNLCQKAAALNSLAEATRHARRAGDVRALREIVWAMAYHHVYGPTPVKQVLAWLDAQPEEVVTSPAWAHHRARLMMMLGSFDEAATLI